MKKEICEYEQKALDFLERTGTSYSAKFLEHNFYWPDDKDKRDIYLITLVRGNRSYSFKFGQSVFRSGRWIIWGARGKEFSNADKRPCRPSFEVKKNKDFSEPAFYDVACCLTKYDVGSFADFCSSFGYDDDSISAKKTYDAVVDEYNNLKMLFSDSELEEMGGIE